jgi:hypothetical protein
VIRWKLAEMARQVESTHAMLESLTYQMCTMTQEDANEFLGGDMALIKVRGASDPLVPRKATRGPPMAPSPF